MNIKTVKRLVTAKLIDITFLENSDLLIGKYVFNQIALGIYIIDFGDNDISFNLRDYQEKYISSEFYKTPGYFQWNYYLIFLRDKYDEAVKQRIEKDGIYTRKFVFTPDEFNDYFEYKHSQIDVEIDVISNWKEKLRDVDLDEVYSEEPYAQSIPRFLSKDVIKDIDEDDNNIEIKQDLIINEISSISLKKDYRKYPKKRDFNLGQVNLVTGVNGTGKTSFLEAIELVITGKSSRDPKFNENNSSINALYNKKIKDNYTPRDNNKYRKRDNIWYSNMYKKGNDLYRAFNKYNFYDSDAAYNLHHGSSDEDLTKYFSSIALGTEFNRIQKRLTGFKERLEREKKILDNQKKIENDNINENSKILKNTKLTSTPEENFNTFISYSNKIKWKKELPKTYNKSFSKFTSNYKTSQSIINSLNQLIGKVKLQSYKAIKNRLAKLEKALEDCNKIKIQLTKIDETLTDKKKSSEVVKKHFQTLESAKRFYMEQTSFSLWKLNDKIKELSIKIKNDTRAVESFDKVTDKKIFQMENTFDFFKEEQFSKRQELIEKRKELNLQIENLKLNLSKLQQVVSEIKSYGKRYLTLNKEANLCPLCETPYTFAELSSRISNIAKAIDENVVIDKLNNQLIQLDSDLSKVNDTATNIKHLESAISTLSEPEYPGLSLIKIGNIFNSLKKNLDKNNKEQSRLVKLKQDLDDKEFYEKDYDNLKNEFENTFPDIKFSFEEKDKFEACFLKIENEKADLLEEINKVEQKSKDLNNSLTKIIEKVAPGIDILEYDSELTYQIELLKNGYHNFENLGGYLNFIETENIMDTIQKIDRLFMLYENVNNSLNSQKELKLANQIIIKSKKKIKELEPQCKRIYEGLKVIDYILENQSESKILGDFLEKNEEEIHKIFQNIHSPNEFSQIKFSESKKSILLERRIDREEVPINKISAGQRSALALSLFLALNKKLKNGPDIILFDEPVTYTDDLNILSFLDYLREMIVHENRQVVFATANKKLAGLFEKKFAFLGEENFKKFNFER